MTDNMTNTTAPTFEGHCLHEFHSQEPVADLGPMLVWNDGDTVLTRDNVKYITVYLPPRWDCDHARAVTSGRAEWPHCAFLPGGITC